jgi:hypothetical protein
MIEQRQRKAPHPGRSINRTFTPAQPTVGGLDRNLLAAAMTNSRRICALNKMAHIARPLLPAYLNTTGSHREDIHRRGN